MLMCWRSSRIMSLAILVGMIVSANPSLGNDGAINLSLGLADSNLNMLQDSGADASSESSTTSSKHPTWVTDLESKAWPGFLTGLSGYDSFTMPVSNPLYFEDPFITTDLRFLYIYHKIPGGSVLRGGQVHVAAMQIRVALTEKLALIATKDGYSWVDSHITSAGDGWNDLAVGLKYVLYSNPADQEILTAGLRWEWDNGSSDAWQGGDSHEINPFFSYGKGWDRWHFLGMLGGRIATDRTDANSSVVWGLHLDYELTETFKPLVEVNGTHWVTNADRLPLGQDYLDVGSLGASKASGRDFFSAAVGFRWQAMDNVSVGFAYEFPLESASENVEDYRFTFNTVVSF